MPTQSQLLAFRGALRSSAHTPLCTLESKADRFQSGLSAKPVAKELSDGMRRF